MRWTRLHHHDSRLFDRVARSRTRRLDVVLPKLSVSANNSLLWIVVGSLLAGVGRRRGKRAAGRGVGSIAIASLLVNQVIKRLIRRPRPALRRIPAVRRLDHQPLTTSFPSGHAASAAAFATGVFIEWRAVGVAIAPLAAAVGYSRVYVGVHYPLDVACGALIGVLAAQVTRLQFPAIPADAGSTSPTATARRLAPDPDGGRIGIAVKEDAGSPIDGDVAGRMRTDLPLANVIEVGEDDDLLTTLDEAAEGRAAVGVAGGDGSGAAGAQVALRRDLPLLVVPAGTLNHLARDLRIDRKTEAIDAYRAGQAVAIDVGDADGELFVNTLTFGAYPEMIERRERLQSRIGRWPAHVVATARAIFAADPLEVSINGHQRLIWMAFVGNCHHDPAGFAPAWRPCLDDGLLDLRLLHADRPFARARLLLSILIGRLTSSAAYEQSDVARITVDCGAAELALTLDGDPRTVSGRFEIVKRPQALVVFAPRQSGSRLS
ncbi:MAG: phosphatase PAP2 family protein [Thermoleophilaceae bacterium]|nr:phosphatase PAP2 family protein [Thermoleophilaceae bacterium]